MIIVSTKNIDKEILTLFSEYDDYIINFLGDDHRYYTRYSEKENLENIWVIYFESSPIGCIAYRTKEEGVGEAKRLYVRKEYRGKRISKELLKEVEKYAKEKGCKVLFLDTRITLEPAVSIYRSCGFRITFQQGLYIQMEKEI